MSPANRASHFIAAFEERLRELGYAKASNITYEHRFADGRVERLSKLAKELAALNVDVIIAGNNASIAAARHATSTIPIVMTYGIDPVGVGFVGMAAFQFGALAERPHAMIAVIYARIVLLTVLGALAGAMSASAECAWVLWQRNDTFDARGGLVSSPTEVGATYTTSAGCITAIDGLERRWQGPQTVVMRDARTMLEVMVRDKNQTITKSLSFLCAPDTVDPRGPKGK